MDQTDLRSFALNAPAVKIAFRWLTLVSTGLFSIIQAIKIDLNKHVFDRLDLPPYMSYQTLKSKLVLAVEGSQGFDGVD